MHGVSSALDTLWWWTKKIGLWGGGALVAALVLWLFLLLGTMIAYTWNTSSKAQGREFVLTTGEQVRNTWITWKGVETTPVITYTDDGALEVAPNCSFVSGVVKCFGHTILSVTRKPEGRGDPYTFRAESSNIYTLAGP